ncbi:MAG: hypothetical protein M3401_04400 [Actinomycetota bacterium]|nr:hypothetical protein [Actinomycetota bacterium]
MIDKLKAIFIAIAVIATLAVGGAAIAGAAGGEEPAGGQVVAQATEENEAPGRDDDAGEADEQVTEQAIADQARAAALTAAGGGTVTEIERADEGDSGYEVEVKRADGTFVEIALDPQFGVVSVENDDD